jgi:hypothetical protein
VQRLQLSKRRRPLERNLTDLARSAQKPTGLARSAQKPTGLARSSTDSALPKIKRELREVSLSAIPPNREVLQQSRRYARREVDLMAVSQAAEAKIRKRRR